MGYFNTIQETFLNNFSLQEKDKEDLIYFLKFLEDSGVGKIIDDTIKNEGKDSRGRKGFNPFHMYAMIVYGFVISKGSLRKLEELCRCDLRMIFLMNGCLPSYAAICEFLNNVVVKVYKQLFVSLVNQFIVKFHLDVSEVFLDGSKFEANANKYLFIFKPTTFHMKLDLKIMTLVNEYIPHYFKPSKIFITSSEIANVITILDSQISENNYSKATGKGIRNTPKMVKDYNILCKYLKKCLEYEEKETICGSERNSYYKTDTDATAMCLKEDYYSGVGSNMHAAYNVQIIVSKGIVLDYYVGQERTDFKAFLRTLDIYYEDYGYYPKLLCADSGYGSFENYEYIKNKKIQNFIKFPMWQKFVDGESIDLFKFIDPNTIQCINGKIGKPVRTKSHPKRKGDVTFLIEECKYCRHKQICFEKVKNKDVHRRFFVGNYLYWSYKNEAIKNLLSPKGIEMRVNRSCQVEGAFGIIKQDLEFDRFRRRSLNKVSMELSLVLSAFLIRKLIKAKQGKDIFTYWKAPENLKDETVKVKKRYKKTTKKTISINKKARAFYKIQKRKVRKQFLN